MNQREKRQIENELLAEGLAGLTDPELIQQLAHLVTNWPGDRHDYMRDLLIQCDQDKRQEMYDAIAPKLGFKALPLSTYEARISIKVSEEIAAGRMQVVGEAPHPIEVDGQKFFEVAAAETAVGAIATLLCHRCQCRRKFFGDTAVGAMTAARRKGWTREPGINKECCPECTSALKAEEIVTLSRTENLIVIDKRTSN